MQSTWKFIKTYKKPILITAAAVGGLIGLNSYMSTFQERWNQSTSRSFVSEVHKKGTYFDESINVGNSMIGTQMRHIIKKLKELFIIEQILEDAKNPQHSLQERVQYFEDLKLEIFTYLVSEIYMIAFFITYLRVQLSIISGKMYYDNLNNILNNKKDNPKWFEDSSSRYHIFLNSLENFQFYAIELIVKNVRNSVKNAFENTKVISKITFQNMTNLLNEIKSDLAGSLEQTCEESSSVVYSTYKNHLLNDELNSKSKIFNEIKECRKMIDETLDILKTSDFTKVINDCVNIGFSNLYDFVCDCFSQFQTEEVAANNHNKNESKNDSANALKFINVHQISMPLVKLLPIIWAKNCLNSSIENVPQLNGDGINRQHSEFDPKAKKDHTKLLVQYLVCSDSLTCFAANIYEAFCNEN